VQPKPKALGCGAHSKAQLNAHGGEKEKTLAREDDIEKIVGEIKAVTHAQEAIKSQLSGDLWKGG